MTTHVPLFWLMEAIVARYKLPSSDQTALQLSPTFHCNRSKRSASIPTYLHQRQDRRCLFPNYFLSRKIDTPYSVSFVFTEISLCNLKIKFIVLSPHTNAPNCHSQGDEAATSEYGSTTRSTSTTGIYK